LAQAPLGLLANTHTPANEALRQAWRASMRRGLALLPLAALAVWFSNVALWPALLWVGLLAFFQMGNLLSQSHSLRAGSAWHQAAVRVLPPLVAALFALTAAWLLRADAPPGLHAASKYLPHLPVLVIAAILGYALGTAWLVPVLFQTSPYAENPKQATLLDTAHTVSTQQSDPRSAALRMAHTLVDALLATALLVVWQRLYGAQETGWMSALLRVLGFVPAVVHMAWAQVVLAQGPRDAQDPQKSALWLGLMAWAAVLMLGGMCAMALTEPWLDASWQGVWPYIVPLVLWQGSACLSAAFSHRPFQAQAAARYSWACMGLALLQATVLLAPLGLPQSIDAAAHMMAFALVSSLGLLALTVWMARLR